MARSKVLCNRIKWFCINEPGNFQWQQFVIQIMGSSQCVLGLIKFLALWLVNSDSASAYVIQTSTPQISQLNQIKDFRNNYLEKIELASSPSRVRGDQQRNIATKKYFSLPLGSSSPPCCIRQHRCRVWPITQLRFMTISLARLRTVRFPFTHVMPFLLLFFIPLRERGSNDERWVSCQLMVLVHCTQASRSTVLHALFYIYFFL